MNEEFALPDGSYSISNIQDNFEYILRHETVSGNPSIKIFVNKIENRTTFGIKTLNYLELLTPETIKLLESSKSKITKKLEITSFRNYWSRINALCYCEQQLSARY